jgi:hypothetical protein
MAVREQLFGKFAAVEAVMRHPPRCVAIAGDVQLNARIAGTRFTEVWTGVVDRDEVNLYRPDPSRPPPVARQSHPGSVQWTVSMITAARALVVDL